MHIYTPFKHIDAIDIIAKVLTHRVIHLSHHSTHRINTSVFLTPQTHTPTAKKSRTTTKKSDLILCSLAFFPIPEQSELFFLFHPSSHRSVPFHTFYRKMLMGFGVSSVVHRSWCGSLIVCYMQLLFITRGDARFTPPPPKYECFYRAGSCATSA